jgi:hypothetical protein
MKARASLADKPALQLPLETPRQDTGLRAALWWKTHARRVGSAVLWA